MYNMSRKRRIKPEQEYNFQTRKSLHVKLTTETHTQLRILALKYKISMQELFEELARHVVEQRPYMEDVLQVLYENKRYGNVNRDYSVTDAESIFKIIEDDNPMGE